MLYTAYSVRIMHVGDPVFLPETLRVKKRREGGVQEHAQVIAVHTGRRHRASCLLPDACSLQLLMKGRRFAVTPRSGSALHHPFTALCSDRLFLPPERFSVWAAVTSFPRMIGWLPFHIQN